MNIDNLLNKPVTIYAKGKKRTIGKITDAKIVDNSVHFTATIDDETIKRAIKAAMDAGKVSDVTSS